MENFTDMDNFTDIGNITVSSNTNVCHAWLADYFTNLSSASLTEVNDTLLLRYIGGIVFLSIIIVVGLVGNIHVLLVCLRWNRSSHYRIFLAWLASLDIFNCAVVAPMVIHYHVQSIVYPNEILCKVFRFLLYGVAIASTSSLVVIAVDRYRKICKGSATSKAKLLCLSSLGVGIVLSWPALFLFGLEDEDVGVPHLKGSVKRCIWDPNEDKRNVNFLYLVVLHFYFFAVSIALSVLYIMITRTIRNSREFQKSIRRASIRPGERMVATPTKRSTYILCTVTIAYIVSALPHHLLVYPYIAVDNFDCGLSLPWGEIYYIFIWSYFLNSAVNPFIYGINDEKFRNAIKDMYCGKKNQTISKMISYTTSSRSLGSRRDTETFTCSVSDEDVKEGEPPDTGKSEDNNNRI